MATITYPAIDLGAPKRAPNGTRNGRRRNSSGPDRAGLAAALAGMGVMALAGAAATVWKRPELALGGLVVGALAAGLVFERGTAAR